MSLTSILREEKAKAAQQAATKTAKDHLKAQQANLRQFSELLEQAQEIDVVVSHNEGETLCVLPLPVTEKTYLEKGLVSAVVDALKNYHPEPSSYDGQMAYILEGREFPKTVPIRVQGLDFTVNLVPVALPDERPTALGNAYHAIGNAGEKFQIAIRTPGPFRRWAHIPARKDVRPYFPGLKVPFNVELKSGDEVVLGIYGGSKGDEVGSYRGAYIQGKGIKAVFDSYTPLVDNQVLVQQNKPMSGIPVLHWEIQKPGESYKITKVTLTPTGTLQPKP
jgi:hypothetical protein